MLVALVLLSFQCSGHVDPDLRVDQRVRLVVPTSHIRDEAGGDIFTSRYKVSYSKAVPLAFTEVEARLEPSTLSYHLNLVL